MSEIRNMTSTNRRTIISLLYQLNLEAPCAFSTLGSGAGARTKMCQLNSSTRGLERKLSTSSCSYHGHDDGVPGSINITFIDKDQNHINVLGKIGETALDLAHRYDIRMEGACEGSLACTTCHCYVEPDHYYDILPEASEKEEDLLDGAPFLDVNSRLGCQVMVAGELDGVHLRLPKYTRNFYVDGHVPTPH